jgi:hypothetical protein
MILAEPDRLGSDPEFGVERATDLGTEWEVPWSFESEKAPHQMFGVREKTPRPARRRVPLPTLLEHLLVCRSEQIPELGMRALNWLKARSQIFRNRMLERLASRIAEPQREDNKEVQEQNRIAALEILATFQSPAAITLLESWLRSRPIAEGHLYLPAMPRSLHLPGTPWAARFAEVIAPAFEEVVSHGQLDTEWGRRFGVEVFRTLE